MGEGWGEGLYLLSCLKTKHGLPGVAKHKIGGGASRRGGRDAPEGGGEGKRDSEEAEAESERAGEIEKARKRAKGL